MTHPAQTRQYTFSVEPWGYTVTHEASSERAAHRMAWEALADETKEGCECLDLVDITEAA